MHLFAVLVSAPAHYNSTRRGRLQNALHAVGSDDVVLDRMGMVVYTCVHVGEGATARLRQLVRATRTCRVARSLRLTQGGRCAQVVDSPSVWRGLLTHCVRIGSAANESPPVLQWVLFIIVDIVTTGLLSEAYVASLTL